jgi:hypothetical protein
VGVSDPDETGLVQGLLLDCGEREKQNCVAAVADQIREPFVAPYLRFLGPRWRPRRSLDQEGAQNAPAAFFGAVAGCRGRHRRDGAESGREGKHIVPSGPRPRTSRPTIVVAGCGGVVDYHHGLGGAIRARTR